MISSWSAGRPRPVLVVLAAVAVVLVAVSACTSAKTTSGEGSPLGSVSATSPETTVPTDTPTTTDAATSTSATSTSSTSASTTKPPAKSQNTCPFAELGIRALRGSGAQQREYAAIMFTNKSAKPCTMYGFPGISLRYQGAALGQPASRDLSAPPAPVHLNPGDLVKADIVDVSTCQAPLSDTVRVYPPDSTKYVDLPLQLRGCTLTVKPVA